MTAPDGSIHVHPPRLRCACGGSTYFLEALSVTMGDPDELTREARPIGSVCWWRCFDCGDRRTVGQLGPPVPAIPIRNPGEGV